MLPRAKQFLEDSTVHSLSRLTSDRKPHVKLLWLAALLTSLVFCTWRISELGMKFASREISTTVKANHLPFEFPDIYVCSLVPISGSYSATMSPEDLTFLRRYRQLVNQSMQSFNDTDINSRMQTFLTRLAQTLPFKFVADKLGHNWQEQNFIMSNMTVQIDTFRHHKFINCAHLNWSGEYLKYLESTDAFFMTMLYTDPPVPGMLDRSEPDSFDYYGVDTLRLRPVDLNSVGSTPEWKSSSLSVFLVPRGQYPSDWDEPLLVGPGAEHKMVIKMQDIVYDETDFAGQCSAEHRDTVDFVNLYNGEKVTFRYSYSACRYREFTRLVHEAIGCLIDTMPLPWELRNLTYCQNVTSGIRDASSLNSGEIDAKAKQLCEARKPCRTRVYTSAHSSGSWPSEYTYEEFLSKVVTWKTVTSNASATPGLQFLAKNGSFEAAKASLLLLTISGFESLCTETRLSYAYSGNSLLADSGGMLGLFLGMSLLSVLELVELAHDCLLTAACRTRRQTQTGDSAQDSAKGARTTAQSLTTLSQTQVSKWL